MNTRQQKAAALQWAVKKYASEFTDRQLAERYKLPVERVKKARQRLGIKKAGYRHKVV